MSALLQIRRQSNIYIVTRLRQSGEVSFGGWLTTATDQAIEVREPQSRIRLNLLDMHCALWTVGG